MALSDIDRFTSLLRSTAGDIKLAAEKAKTNPAAAMEFVPAIMKNMRDLQTFGKLDKLTPTSVAPVYEAINLFLNNTKEAQEKVGAMGAALFKQPVILEVTSNLQRIKKKLDEDRGGKVSQTEHEAL